MNKNFYLINSQNILITRAVGQIVFHFGEVLSYLKVVLKFLPKNGRFRTKSQSKKNKRKSWKINKTWIFIVPISVRSHFIYRFYTCN